MDTLSVWRATAPATGYGMLQGDVSTDVLVIGGGITGVTLACLLAEQGRQVVLLEADEIGSGSTGNSTGNLYETLSRGMQALEAAWDLDTCRQVATARRETVAFIEARAALLGDVAFRRCPLMLYAMNPSEQEYIETEVEVLRGAGCVVERASSPPPGLPPASADLLVLPDQAQFNPQAYVARMARAAVDAGASVHEHSRVLALDTKNKVATTAGGTVQAREIVMATHTPKGVHMVHAEMPVQREYGIAMEWDGPDPGPGIFYWRGSEGLSIRTHEADGKRYLVCVGQEHKVGIHNAKAGLLALEHQALKQFGDRPIAHRWSAQNYHGADGLPYIGRNQSDCYIATGFFTDGLTWGTLAARMIAEQLAGREHPLGELLRPNRLNPLKAAKNIIEENVTVVTQLVKDYLTHRQEEKLSALAPGDSAIVEAEGESVAAWRSPAGELFAVSNVCPHMGCKVHWNSVETSWDCPCHGSRFRPDGTVIEGPALAPLKRMHLPPLGDQEPGT